MSISIPQATVGPFYGYERKLEAARSTIAELDKRIGELDSLWNEACTRLTAERQRRESAEAALCEIQKLGVGLQTKEIIRSYFSRYSSSTGNESDHGSTEAENE